LDGVVSILIDIDFCRFSSISFFFFLSFFFFVFFFSFLGTGRVVRWWRQQLTEFIHL